MQQRYYDPIAGRFLSVDPVVTDANSGAGFGLYTYVNNNPYGSIDPDGRLSNDDCRKMANCTVLVDDGSRGNKPSSKSTTAAPPPPSAAVGSPGGPEVSTPEFDNAVASAALWSADRIDDYNKSDVGRAIEGLGPMGGTEIKAGALGLKATLVGIAKIASAAGTTFKTAHYAPRLQAAVVNIAKAEAAVLREVSAMRGSMATNANAVGRLTVDGVQVQYVARLLPNGTVNVGTIYPVK